MVQRTAPLLLAGAFASLTAATAPLPLVIWHGLGDTFDNPGLQSVADLYTSIYPGAATHIISLGEDGGADRKASYFGSLPGELSGVCDQLASNPNLTSTAAPHGIHALGFSQGGLFMRGYVEACNSPKVHTLATFGSPHNGISEFVKCKITDWVCRAAFGFLNANKWSEWVQSNIVPAQYYRHPTPEELEKYLEHSGFLADINNERELKNAAYKDNLGGMEGGLVLYQFDEDETIHPKESVWLAEVTEEGEVTWLTDREMYKQDWLGLKKLNEAGKMKFLKTPGPHMHITDDLLKEVFTKYLWQPEGVVPKNVDSEIFRESLSTLAEPYKGDMEGEEEDIANQPPVLRVQNMKAGPVWRL
ncbi:Dolichyldiphosphatase [Dactylellina cionopaga]|nr:Dolichyldiphosphatase [Dactylellina cionopaga]